MAQIAVKEKIVRIQQFVPLSPDGPWILIVSAPYVVFSLLHFAFHFYMLLFPFFSLSSLLLPLFWSVALLSNHSLALSFALYSCLRLSPSLCKTFIFIYFIFIFPCIVIFYGITNRCDNVQWNLFLCKSTLHVSGGTHAHHQEYNPNCMNSHWYNS